jgi:bacteriorhodopsin
MYSYFTRMYSCVTRVLLVCYSYVTRMSLVCTRMSLVCYSYVLVCTRMSLVCYSYVLVWCLSHDLNKVPKNLFGSVLPNFPVVSIIAFLVTMEIVVKKYVIESQEFCISRFLPVSTPAVPRVDPSMCNELLNVFRSCKHRRPRQNQVDFALNINQS